MADYSWSKWKNVVRVMLSGDQGVAASWLPLVRGNMLSTMHRIKAGLKQYVIPTVTLPDGSQVRISSLFGQDTIEIWGMTSASTNYSYSAFYAFFPTAYALSKDTISAAYNFPSIFCSMPEAQESASGFFQNGTDIYMSTQTDNPGGYSGNGTAQVLLNWNPFYASDNALAFGTPLLFMGIPYAVQAVSSTTTMAGNYSYTYQVTNLSSGETVFTLPNTSSKMPVLVTDSSTLYLFTSDNPAPTMETGVLNYYLVGGSAFYSNDGVNWNQVTTPDGAQFFCAVNCGGSIYVGGSIVTGDMTFSPYSLNPSEILMLDWRPRTACIWSVTKGALNQVYSRANEYGAGGRNGIYSISSVQGKVIALRNVSQLVQTWDTTPGWFWDGDTVSEVPEPSVLMQADNYFIPQPSGLIQSDSSGKNFTETTVTASIGSWGLIGYFASFFGTQPMPQGGSPPTNDDGNTW
ncbi:MAG: hypothetical protein ACLQBD_01140 [Syntrophobacteraceae bacterium]